MSALLKILQLYGDQLEITTKNGEIWTTTMSIGAVFGKPHNQVLRDIARIDMPTPFRQKNYVQRWKSFKNPCTRRNNYSPYFDCTLKGLMALLLNWNSELFQRIKIDIINDYFTKELEISRLTDLINGQPYQEVDKWQRQMAEKMFNVGYGDV